MEMFTAAVLLLPFIGTTVGSLWVFGLRAQVHPGVRRALEGFAAGVMVAASVWSLLLPAIERSGQWGALAFFPAFAGLWAGFLFLLLLERLIPGDRGSMLLPAVTLHNLPEGMAVGVALAAWLQTGIGGPALLALSLGIGLQNIPEGAIISMPLHSGGMGKGKAFLMGVLSGAVEPVGAALTVVLAALVTPALPFFLSFAAGAMLYVVVEELIPNMEQAHHSDMGTVFFAVGFSLMMALDVALG